MKAKKKKKESSKPTYFSIFTCIATTTENMTAIHTSFSAYLGPSVIQAIASFFYSSSFFRAMSHARLTEWLVG